MVKLSDYLTANEMDQLLFYKDNTLAEVKSRVSFSIYGAPETTNSMKSMNSYTISSAGPTSASSLTYVMMNKGDIYLDSIEVMQYY